MRDLIIPLNLTIDELDTLEHELRKFSTHDFDMRTAPKHPNFDVNIYRLREIHRKLKDLGGD